jgi:RHS repeat-associated protein
MTAALHRAAKTRTARAPLRSLRSGAHASRWADDRAATRVPQLPRLRAEHRARRSPLGGRTRVGPSELYGYDAHGNIGFLADATGAVTDTYTYDAWGNLIGRTGSVSNTRLFAGEELDPDVGLIGMRARQYSATVGRFSTLDPWEGDAQSPVSLHRYVYANGDPVNQIDPSGRGSVALEYVAINVQDAVITTALIVASGYVAGCAFVAGLQAFDVIQNEHSVPAIWQFCMAKGGPKNIENEFSRDARLQSDPCAFLRVLYEAARAKGDTVTALKIKTAQKALGCRKHN